MLPSYPRSSNYETEEEYLSACNTFDRAEAAYIDDCWEKDKENRHC